MSETKKIISKTIEQQVEEKLKPCPFCSGEAEVIRYGNGRQSTQYSCTECGCNLETSEEFNHGGDWNERPQERERDKIAREEMAGLTSELIDDFNDVFPEATPNQKRWMAEYGSEMRRESSEEERESVIKTIAEECNDESTVHDVIEVLTTPLEECEHKWIDATNERVSGTAYCDKL